MRDTLDAPNLQPKIVALGVDMLDTMEEYVRTVEREAHAIISTPAPTQSQLLSSCISKVTAALEWLQKAQSAGLLVDCGAASIAHVEEEWCCVETELQTALARTEDHSNPGAVPVDPRPSRADR